MPTAERADLSRIMPGTQCVAHKKTGEQCQKMAIRGARVCRFHGGAAPQVKAAARTRIELAADKLAQRLLQFAFDGTVADPVALAAIRDALDRAGLSAKQNVEIEVGPTKPYEQILSRLEGGSRAQWRRNRGEEPPTPALVVGEPLDAEVVADEALSHDSAAVPGDGDWQPADDTELGTYIPVGEGNPFEVGQQQDCGMMPVTEAVAQQAALRRNAASRQAQRALPRGR